MFRPSSTLLAVGLPAHQASGGRPPQPSPDVGCPFWNASDPPCPPSGSRDTSLMVVTDISPLPGRAGLPPALRRVSNVVDPPHNAAPTPSLSPGPPPVMPLVLEAPLGIPRSSLFRARYSGLVLPGRFHLAAPSLPAPQALPCPPGLLLCRPVLVLEPAELGARLGLVRRRQPAPQHGQPDIAPQHQPAPHPHRRHHALVLVALVDVRANAAAQQVRLQEGQRLGRVGLRGPPKVGALRGVDAGYADGYLLGRRVSVLASRRRGRQRCLGKPGLSSPSGPSAPSCPSGPSAASPSPPACPQACGTGGSCRHRRRW